MSRDFKKAGDNDTSKLATMASRMASKGAKVFQTWFDGRDKLDKLMLAGEISYYTKQKDKTIEDMLNYKFDEATLSPAQLKKRDEIKKAIDRDEPNMDKSKKIAIATATAKKVADSIVHNIDALLEREIKKEKEAPKQVPQDPDADEVKGTQPKKYYKGVAKKSKISRARHFNRLGSKDDDDPSAYKDAPGDKKARESGKPMKKSKHTLKFKQMFGDD